MPVLGRGNAIHKNVLGNMRYYMACSMVSICPRPWKSIFKHTVLYHCLLTTLNYEVQDIIKFVEKL